MQKERLEFYRLGQEFQSRPDFSVEFKRVDIKTIQKWSPEKRRAAADWLKLVERGLEKFKKEILTA